MLIRKPNKKTNKTIESSVKKWLLGSNVFTFNSFIRNCDGHTHIAVDVTRPVIEDCSQRFQIQNHMARHRSLLFPLILLLSSL